MLNNTENRNSNSQLIATTHKVYLLDIKDIFRKDEIWFVEKDKHGQSVLYSLANTDVENLDLAAGYLNGRFGAIPFIKDLKSIAFKTFFLSPYFKILLTKNCLAKSFQLNLIFLFSIIPKTYLKKSVSL